jgi:hypothetical protein
MRRAGVCVLLLAGAAAASAPAGAGAAAGPRFTPALHHDPAEPHDAAPDLRGAAFGQVGTQLSLTLHAKRAWSPGDSSCVTLLRDEPVGRLCVSADRSRHAQVRFAKPHGRLRAVRGAAGDRSGRALRATVYPRALGLSPGRFSWFVRGRSGDRLPNRGTLPLRVSVYGAPHCFGAAARAGENGCVNPALRRFVTPAPADAELMPDLRCRRVRNYREYAPVVPCYFGADYAAGPPRLALLGDSHAMSFRSTADVAAQALGQKAISLTEAGCGLATEVYPGWPRVGKRCRRYTEQALRWLDEHPSIRTVVITSSSTHGYTEDGLRAMWSRIPASVRDIYVVVDVPRVTYKTADCVAAVRRRHALSEGACALPRDEKTLPPDPQVGAAEGAEPRVHLVDLTRYFCDSEHCFPVIGGAYVYRDTNHMNLVFAPTLGPYLLEGMGLSP